MEGAEPLLMTFARFWLTHSSQLQTMTTDVRLRSFDAEASLGRDTIALAGFLNSYAEEVKS